MMNGTAPLEDVVPPGAGLTNPSGLELRNGLLYVSDNSTGEISAWDLTGQKVNSFSTGLPAGSLAGINFGPDGKLYFVDMVGDRVFRLDPVTQ
jgi:DNA-binding beta-propeller fold protein YncE